MLWKHTSLFWFAWLEDEDQPHCHLQFQPELALMDYTPSDVSLLV